MKQGTHKDTFAKRTHNTQKNIKDQRAGEMGQWVKMLDQTCQSKFGTQDLHVEEENQPL